MFNGFAHVWTPVTFSSRLKEGRPLALGLAGEKLVFFRDGRGGVAALIDRCPHRGVALSLGTVKDGCLTCPFHGWSFDGAGAVCSVPFNPRARKELLGATALPCQDRGGLLWVYTAAIADPPALVLPDLLEDTRLARIEIEEVWNVHWTRAMENMLDWVHLPFIHRKSIGVKLAKVDPATPMEVHVEQTPYGLSSTISLGGQAEPGRLDFYRPNLMELHVPIPGKLLRLYAAQVPVDDTHVRMVNLGLRDFATSPLLGPLFGHQNRGILLEDRAVVESSAPCEVPERGGEVSVATDKLTLMFRNYYLKVLRPSSASTGSAAA